MPAKPTITQLLRRILRATGIAMLLTIVTAFILSFVPVNTAVPPVPAQDSVQIYLTSNGIHTDLVLPVKTPYIDWRGKIPLEHFAGADSSFTHIGFGWGDRAFYMQTPEWSDLTIEVALDAVFWPSPSAMHVEYIRRPLRPTKHQRPINLSQKQYQQLVTYIYSSFQSQNGHFMLIPGKGYSATDNFYEANEKFYFPKTCNYWVNNGLKAADLKAAFFAPFPYAVMRHYR
ncbi:TIGR02117 family protein [Pontibacter sp. Tf4]|uniref:TIGR02117 family protein n=1 Tax=Pontibacter sp. Tf4 TaxID=2761620 RepID=UPI001624F30C|nr:TIGR02117 family protein [Pontibacter sp. Tf4]MBB6612205.1 TIGR02117 family protein [Pontibacter sp. Tf4]